MTFESSPGLFSREVTTTPGLSEVAGRRAAPTSDWTDMGADEHFAQFYESDDVIVDAVAEYVIHALKSDHTVVLAATHAHLVKLQKVLKAFGIDVKDAERKGCYVPLDARKTLDAFLVDGKPDAALFESVVGTVMKKAESRGRNIRAYGEMVGLLCEDDNYAGAVELEDLWNGLRKKIRFSLFCGYPMSSLKSAGKSMGHICETHGSLIPNESYTSLSNTDERLRRIVALEQRIVQLEAELSEMRSRRNARAAM